MRIASPSSYKFKSRILGGGSRDGKPPLGHVPRLLYDYLVERKGTPVLNKTIMTDLAINDNRLRVSIYALTDFWGLDIRSVPDCHHKCLVGEWFGDKYEDYVAEKIKD